MSIAQKGVRYLKVFLDIYKKEAAVRSIVRGTLANTLKHHPTVRRIPLRLTHAVTS